jgi:hypothetical protein
LAVTGPRVEDARGLQSSRNPEAIGSHQLTRSQPPAFLVVQTEALIRCPPLDKGSLIILYGFRLDGLQRESLPDLGAFMVQAIGDRKEDTDPLMPDVATIEQDLVVQNHALGRQYVIDHRGRRPWTEGSEQPHPG